MKGEVERVKEKALALGFSHVGIAGAEPVQEETLRLREWLSRGYQASMGWMERKRREDPRTILPGARAVIVTAMNYYTPDRHPDEDGVGKVSRYAWGDDYHRVVLARLGELERWVEGEFPGERALAYVDTGPLQEKALAVRAGIGWQGKHTNVITQDRGSWIFLGEVITTLDLPPDTPAADHCGSCTLCIEACPTGAIVAPYLVDAARCLSYLTIEHRGPVADPPPYDGWIYGCDICQDVCPWNDKFSVPSAEPAFRARPGNVAPLLEEWEKLTEEEFEARFAGSPIRRAKREGLVRNVRIVRAQRGEPPPAAS
jgi:epoxyqueuosine reductase